MFADKTLKVTKEFTDLKENYQTDKSDEFNLETLDLFLKYDVVKPELIHKLIDNGKIKIKDANKILNKYEEE